MINNLLPLSSVLPDSKKENFFFLKIIAINLASSHLDLKMREEE